MYLHEQRYDLLHLVIAHFDLAKVLQLFPDHHHLEHQQAHALSPLNYDELSHFAFFYAFFLVAVDLDELDS